MFKSKLKNGTNIQSKGILYSMVLLSSVFILTACDHEFGVSGNVSGAVGTVKLTNNGADEVFMGDNGLFIFEKTLEDGDSYDVNVVPGSDTSQGQLCSVTGGSNGDGSGIINGAHVTDIMVTCVGV